MKCVWRICGGIERRNKSSGAGLVCEEKLVIEGFVSFEMVCTCGAYELGALDLRKACSGCGGQEG